MDASTKLAAARDLPDGAAARDLPDGAAARDLPDGWVWTTLGEACQVILGQSPPSDTYNAQGVGLPFYQGKAEFGDLYPTPVRWCSEPIRVAQAGDVLFSVRAPVGPTNLCREKSCIGRGLAALRPRVGIPDWYFYFLRSIEQDWPRKTTGTTFASISGRALRKQPVPLAPLPEQRRVVARIKSLFARLDEVTASLERTRANLGRYRVSLLQAACEGRLVSQDDAGDPEPAERLLARILAERRAGQGRKCREPQPPDAEGLPPLPPGWVWAALGQLLSGIDAGQSPAAQNRPALKGEFGVLKVSAVGATGFLPRENKALLPGDTPGDAPRPRAGDLLISRANTVERVGAVALVDRDYPNLMLSDKTLRLVPASKEVLRPYLLYALKSPLARSFFARRASGTSSSMRNLSRATLRATPIPLPPLAEQRRIVREVERRLAVIEALATSVETNLDRAGRLRRAVLRRAFRGHLAPQDPHDEPVAVLLARIDPEKGQEETS